MTSLQGTTDITGLIGRDAVAAPRTGTARRPRSHTLTADHWGIGMTAAVVGLGAAGFSMGFLWWLGALTALGFAAALVGLVRPALGLMAIALLCTLDSVMRHFLLDAGVQYLRFNTLNYWLLLVMALNHGLMRRFRDTQTKLFIAFIALLTLEMAMSERPARGAQHVLGILSTFGLLVYFVRAGANDRAWYWQGVVSGTAAAVGGLMYNVQREQILLLNHNVYALFPETAIFALCLAFGFAANRRQEFVLVALAAVNIVWVFLTGSRGGLLIATAALSFILFAMRGAGKKLVYVAGATALVTLVSGSFADLQSASMVRFEKLWSADETADARTSGRTSLVLGGWHIFINHPLGVGTGDSEYAWSRLGYVAGISNLKAGEEFSLHSGWMKVLAENGLPGFLLFGAVVGSFAVAGWKSRDRFLRAFGITVTLTLAVAFLSTEFQGKAFWFLSAGAITLLNRQRMLAAVAGGRRQSVWWVRPAVPTDVLRPRAVGAPPDAAPSSLPASPPRPLV